MDGRVQDETMSDATTCEPVGGNVELVTYPGAPWPELTEREAPDAGERWQAALDLLLEAGEAQP